MSTQGDQTVLVPVEQDTIPFYGHDLIAVRLPDGQIAAVMRWLCESLQLDIDGQLQRIQRKTALRKGLVRVRVQTAGGPQEMPAITLKVLPGYLFGIDENRVKEAARADVILFQEECVEALAEHFTAKHKLAVATGGAELVPVDASAVTALVEQMADLTGVLNLMREHLAALLSLPGQVAELSAHVSAQTVEMGETRALVESLATRQDVTETQLAAVDERTQRLTSAHTFAVQEMVNSMVRQTKNAAYPLTYTIIYGRLKRQFHVGSYKEIADARYDEVLAYLHDMLVSAVGDEGPEQGNLF